MNIDEAVGSYAGQSFLSRSVGTLEDLLWVKASRSPELADGVRCQVMPASCFWL